MASAEKPLLGFVGLGQMGAPMARNLLAAGFPLVVHNRSRAIVDTFASEGAQTAASAREVAERVEILFTCVGFPADVERVYLGEGGAIEGARSGQVFCDLSTVGPETHQLVAARLKEQGVGYLDAPISGGTSGAKAGTLTIMVGGQQSDFDHLRPMFEAMGKNIHLVGPTGAGATIKLVNQMMNAIALQASAEGLVLATKAGIDPKLAHAILRTSSGGNAALDGLANAAFNRDFEPGFTVEMSQKDVALATAIGRKLGVRLLFGSLAEQLLVETRAAGYSRKAPPAAIQIHEKIAGIEVVPQERKTS
jgi:3-hydroxyisobutyrate dehydrogenase-like beta-hydroxyacid dehydrogenase